MIKVFTKEPKPARFGQAHEDNQPKNSLFTQPVQPIQVDLTDRTLWYGSENAFPLKLAQLIQDSPAGSSCVSIIGKFIEGNGFSDPSIGEIQANGQGDTFSDIHSKISEAYALNEGFALNIKYTIEGKISEVFSVPFENVRLKQPDDKGIISKVNVNPYYGTNIFQKRFTEEYDLFNPDRKVVLAQIAKSQSGKKNTYKGQILYFANTKPLSRFYSIPSYYAAKHWLSIDGAIGEFHSNNLDAGFFQTVLLKMIGNPDEPSTHPDDQKQDENGQTVPIRTRGERFNIEMQQFTGSDSKTKMMVLWEMAKDMLPELQEFPAITNEQFFTTLQDLTTRNILIAFGVPSVLANMGKDNSLSDGNQMANATKVMHDRVSKPQNQLVRIYKQLLTNWKTPYLQDFSILNNNNFDTPKIDPLIWAELSSEEKRKYIQENTDYPVIAGQKPETPVTTPANSFSNVFFNDYPDVKDSIKRALKFMDDNTGCGTKMGRQMSENIINRTPLSFKDIKRICGFLRRNKVHENKLFTDSCDSCKYAAWGGNKMLEYCEAKIKMINE